MDEEIELNNTARGENNNFLKQYEVAPLIASMIQTPDEVIRGFTSMEIENRIVQIGIDLKKIERISLLETGSIILQGWNSEGVQTALLIHVPILLDPESSELERTWAIDEISYDEAARRQIEQESQFREEVVQLEVLADAINTVLNNNDSEYWENINRDDVITEGLFHGKTLVEAILLYRKNILQASDSLRKLGKIHAGSSPELIQAQESLFDANDNYLLLILGIGERREELTHVIPKSSAECDILMNGLIARKSPRELLVWLKQVHQQIDENNWQSGTVEKNYSYFSQEIHKKVLERLRHDIYENSESDNYHNPELFLEFATLVSGRPSWKQEGGIFNYDSVSPVDSRLWDPENAEKALILAMDIPTNTEDNTQKESMISVMISNMEMRDPLLDEGKNLGEIIHESIEKIGHSVIVPIKNGGEVKLGESSNFSDLLKSLKLDILLKKIESGMLGNSYNDLTLEEMITISSLVRVGEKIEGLQAQTRTVTGDTPYEAKKGESVQTHRNYGSGPAYISIIKTNQSEVNYDEFNTIFEECIKQGTEHVGNELNRNFQAIWDSTQSELSQNKSYDEFGDLDITLTDEDINKQFALKLGINPQSEEYKILTLYNDINGVGGFWEVSDTTRDGAKTAGFMIAMIAGSVLIGGAAVAALRVGTGVAIGLATEGAVMGASGSAIGYGLDSTLGDARGFYTPSESLTGLGSDFTLGAVTGAIGGPLVSRFGNPEAAFFSKASTINKGIFAGDLALLGLGPEHIRIQAVNKVWHGSEISEQGENPIISKLDEIHRGLLSNPSDEVWDAFIQDPSSQKVSDYVKKYRISYDVFPMIGMEQINISQNFDIRLQRAISIFKLLNPGASIDIFHSMEEEFHDIGRVRDYESQEEYLQAILTAAELWILRQEKRFGEII